MLGCGWNRTFIYNRQTIPKFTCPRFPDQFTQEKVKASDIICAKSACTLAQVLCTLLIPSIANRISDLGCMVATSLEMQTSIESWTNEESRRTKIRASSSRYIHQTYLKIASIHRTRRFFNEARNRAQQRMLWLHVVSYSTLLLNN